MSRLPDQWLDELRTRLPIAQVVGRRVRLQRKGRTHQGCCPFHSEKTPSFFVYDDHFHCFGCGAHGDVISFTTRAQGGDFREVVEELAREAGLEMPREEPRQAARARQEMQLRDVLEAACEAFQRRLWSAEGSEGLAYLRRRGLTTETIRSWRLGWSGPGRGALATELMQRGATIAQLVEAGLMLERDGRPVDLFFDRVMFPIRDLRGRVISFSGRVLGDAKPKYVNGPETAIFQKRRVLFGAEVARRGVFGGAPALLVEGQLDVIALHQAGFPGAMAPLGTALTLEHLHAAWAISPEPVLAFDGDAAGAKAQARAVELMLPELTPERSARLAVLPPGSDPDDLLRAEGPAGVGRVIGAARPVSLALYGLLVEGRPRATPEERAALRGRLEAAAAAIQHRALAGEYRRSLLQRFFAEGKRPALAPVSRVAPSLSAGDAARLRLIAACVVKHSSLRCDVAIWAERVPASATEAGAELQFLVDCERSAGGRVPASVEALLPAVPDDVVDAAQMWREAANILDLRGLAGDVRQTVASGDLSARNVARIISLREAALAS